MTLHQFEEYVSQALDELPAEFLKKLENVAVTIDAWPNFHQLNSVNLVQLHEQATQQPDTIQPMSWRPKGMLFGLYQGVPRTKQSVVTPPAKITLFAGPIVAVSRTADQLKAKIQQVLKHEIGHHFGFSEDKLRNLGY